MKTTEQVQREITRLRKDLEADGLTRRQITKNSKRIRELQQICIYLESEPTEQYLQDELEIHKQMLVNRSQFYNEWTPPGGILKNKANFRKAMGYQAIEAKINTLEFILRD